MPSELTLDGAKCLGCAACVAVCAHGALEQGPDGKVAVAHPERCEGCGECVYVCAGEALAVHKPAAK